MLWELGGLGLVPLSFCLPQLLIDTPIPLLCRLKSDSNRFGAYFGTKQDRQVFRARSSLRESFYSHIARLNKEVRGAFKHLRYAIERAI